MPDRLQADGALDATPRRSVHREGSQREEDVLALLCPLDDRPGPAQRNSTSASARMVRTVLQQAS